MRVLLVKPREDVVFLHRFTPEEKSLDEYPAFRGAVLLDIPSEDSSKPSDNEVEEDKEHVNMENK